MAGYQDIFLNQGETFTTSISLDDQNGASYNLNSFLVASQMKKSYYSSNIVMTFNTIIADANNGVITMSANSAMTANVDPGKYVYDVVVKESSSGIVTRVLEGQVIVSPGVTLSLS